MKSLLPCIFKCPLRYYIFIGVFSAYIKLYIVLFILSKIIDITITHLGGKGDSNRKANTL